MKKTGVIMTMNKENINFDIVQISYDEPNADQNFENIKNFYPYCLRVKGIKGFDQAHRHAASLSKKDWIFIIDGDCDVKTSFFDDIYFFDQDILPQLNSYPDTVFSWSSKNSINGLIYGNGGIKLWPKQLLSSINSHDKGSMDWIGEINYMQMNNWYGYSVVNCTPYQAWRAGLREGTKFCLINNKSTKNPKKDITPQNFIRLMIWLSVGLDEPNGDYAIFGARIGAWFTLCNDWDPSIIKDYDKLLELWNNNFSECQKGKNSNFYEEFAIKLRKYFDFDIVELTSEQSRWFKTTYQNPKREGLLKAWTTQTI